MMPVLEARARRAPPTAEARAGVERRVHVVQGEFHVSVDPDVVLTTILGSCVAACLRDPLAGVGGMNHFLLPGTGEEDAGDTVRYGVHAMELLVNGLFCKGARRERLEAKLFGGARMLDGLSDIGAQNAVFAKSFLQKERIAFTGGSLGGDRGRRVQFWPASGRARQMTIGYEEVTVFAAERRAKAVPVDVGSVELF